MSPMPWEAEEGGLHGVGWPFRDMTPTSNSLGDPTTFGGPVSVEGGDNSPGLYGSTGYSHSGNKSGHVTVRLD